MPLFVIERHFAEQIEMTRDRASEIELINADVGVQWLFSFPQRRPQEVVLFVRGPQRRSDS